MWDMGYLTVLTVGGWLSRFRPYFTAASANRKWWFRAVLDVAGAICRRIATGWGETMVSLIRYIVELDGFVRNVTTGTQVRFDLEVHRWCVLRCYRPSVQCSAESAEEIRWTIVYDIPLKRGLKIPASHKKYAAAPHTYFWRKRGPFSAGGGIRRLRVYRTWQSCSCHWSQLNILDISMQRTFAIIMWVYCNLNWIYLLTKNAIIQLKSAIVRKSWTTGYN